MTPLPDADARRRAIEEVDRNLVVTASAGTGKTTLLTGRALELLLGRRALKLHELVAVTFTDKAAQEMQVRLRGALQGLMDWRKTGRPGDLPADLLDSVKRWAAEARTTPGAFVEGRVRELLEHFEDNEIGTIHHFAARLLKLFPVEAGVDPEFEVDADLSAWDALFRRHWQEWTSAAFRRGASGEKEARALLASMRFGVLRDLAESLARFAVPLPALEAFARGGPPPEPVRQWLGECAASARRLSEAGARADAKCVFTLRTAEAARVFEGWRAGTPPSLPPDGRASDVGKVTQKLETGGLTDADGREANRLWTLVKKLDEARPATLQGAVRILLPFVRSLRDRYLREGNVSFDGLLTLARDLVRSDLDVRQRLKTRFRAFLIDEFQDTDPVQMELLFLLGEGPGDGAEDWAAVRPEAGRLFLVGDPKQSIYSFRGADLGAYDRIVTHLTGPRTEEVTLASNFRSAPAVVEAVNAICPPLMVREEGVQPEYRPLAVGISGGQRNRRGGVEVRLLDLTAGGGPARPKAGEAAREEAFALAHWLSREVIGREEVWDTAAAGTRPARAGDVAILLRKLTDAHLYLDALRGRGIPFRVEGEKHFYTCAEVVDTVNLLRVLDNPADGAALAAFLRSPIAALADSEIYELLVAEAWDGTSPPRRAPEHFRTTWNRVGDWRAVLRQDGPGEVLHRLISGIDLVPLAGLRRFGTQAVANVLKVLRSGADLVAGGRRSWGEMVRTLLRRLREEAEEDESPLAEEAVDAVRVMTVYKAKGLEFPWVILAGCHAGTGSRHDTPPAAFDWAGGILGLWTGDGGTVEGLYLTDRDRVRRRAELRRVLYVGMTRAKERLVISACANAGTSGETVLELLEESIGSPSSEWGPGDLPVRGAILQIRRVGPEAPPQSGRPRSGASAADEAAAAAWVGEWRRREEEVRGWEADPVWTQPSRLTAEDEPKRAEGEIEDPEAETEADSTRNPGREAARRIGTLCHAVLETWDFQVRDPAKIAPAVDRAASSHEIEDPTVRREAREILEAFLASPAAEELAGAAALWREVPMIAPHPDRPDIIRGSIDVVYRLEDRLIVGEYKTDRVDPAEAAARAGRYRPQGEAYCRAVEAHFGQKPEFRVHFLRLGASFSL